MTDTLIEAVGRAMFEKLYQGRLVAWSDETRGLWLPAARAAILATLEGIKEPTDAMKDAGEDGQCEPDFDEAGRVWQAMLTSLIDELKGDL